MLRRRPRAGPRPALSCVWRPPSFCRSDWHGWLGHDADIALPHVRGHELVGVIDAVGPLVRRFRVGQRATVPFVCACGEWAECDVGNGQVCRNQTQPGKTPWPSPSPSPSPSARWPPAGGTCRFACWPPTRACRWER
ncbi:alcohol dehydrogenase catalytic domain-containing protein [Cryobacterium sp. PH31-O1]|uniref:alcohol dehydrogenase catalytic domain-containing protein n=1 Tax=Cryobacterium sp. PH31-O1 TaxID=3046306 RepID=UPI0024BA52C1|nr:alcohol dehydrogenase catalytic domain-containing protein [Cryobacterium sp. PH31-O1]MDJ0339849.1 alcohol dehydrogenase catalytic domain-containing protein [Cryobacterium sp. PH31-O1]